MNGESLLLAAVGLPAALLVACLSAHLKRIVSRLLWLAPIPGLAASLVSAWNVPLALSGAPYYLTLRLDASGSMLLTAASLLWIAAGFYAPAFLRGKALGGSFPVCWLLTLTGSLGIFLAADLASFLLFYALVSLPAYGLVTSDGTPDARRAGAIYMGFALLGENLLLLAFVLLALNAPDGSLMISDVVAALGTAPSRDVILAFLIAGFGMKIALLPMHFWMPLSYTASPVPAAAVLSGAAVKAGVIGLIRFLPFDLALPNWGGLLTTVGLCGAFYGVLVGITQSNPKTILAYSSVSQMGFLAAVLGMGLSAGDVEAGPIAALYGAHHILVKGALFLAVGVGVATGAPRMGVVLVPGVVIALGLAGLPLTGGALAKLAAKAPLGYGFVGTVATWSAAGTALLMLHFLQRVSAAPAQDPRKAPPATLVVPWLAIAAFCVVVPWAFYPVAGLGSLSQAIAPTTLWKTLWPVLAGVGLFVGMRRLSDRLPRVPSGDIVVLGQGLSRLAAAWGAAATRLDDILRLWTPACLALLAIIVVLLAVMLTTS